MNLKKFSLIFGLSLALFPVWAAKTETVTIKTDLVPSPDMNVTIITPDICSDSAKCPTVYLLNGYGGNNTDWSQLIQPKIGELADLYGMVLVMPDGRDSWYWDSPIKPEMKMESFIIDQLVPYIDANYPTIPSPKKRAIMGLSMGGQGALWLAIRHPDVFGSVGSTSGGVNIMPFPTRWRMAEWLGPQEENMESWQQHSIVNLVPMIEPGSLNIIFDCGVDDFFYDVNNQLHQALVEANIPHDYTSRPGAHTREFWRNALYYQLLFFDQAFNRE